MRNWAGNHTYRARRVLEPRALDELQEMVRGSERFRVLGTRHSFNDIGDTDGDLISLVSMPPVLEIDAAGMTATVDGAVRYGDVCDPLHRAGFALQNMASLPHISIAGACATGTHGSGDRSAVLASAVRELSLVRPDGELVHIRRDGRGPVPLAAAAVSLGALGVVADLTLELERTYDVRQDVFEGLPIEAFESRYDELTAMADSVSFFWSWRGDALDQVWLKRRVEPDDPSEALVVPGARPATVDRHPIPGMSPEACTPQLGRVGPWHHRLPHFRLDHTPSSGDELQSEYFVDRASTVDAFAALRELRASIAPAVQVMELRTIARDDLWLSPAHGRSTASIHFTWVPDSALVLRTLPRIEAALGRFRPRPHWGKVFTAPPAVFEAGYPMLGKFRAVAKALDPSGKLRNPYLDRLIFGR